MMKVKTKSNRLTSHRVWLIGLAIIFFVYALTLIVPFLWMVYNSLKSAAEYRESTWAVPQEISKYWRNYLGAFSMTVKTEFLQTEMPLPMLFLNTIYLSFIPPIFSLFFTCCTSYAYARHQFKLKGALYTVMIIPMLVNIAGTLPTVYKLVNQLGIYNNIFLIMVLSWSGSGFNFLLISSIFENISGTYREAAFIDGAGHWRIFITIYLPQISNLLVSLYVLAVIGAWNDYTMPKLYLPEFPTLATGIYQLRLQVQLPATEENLYSGEWPKLFATMIWSILPVLVLFVVFQDKIMTMVGGGGIKE